MALMTTLAERSGSKCELCTSHDALEIYLVPPKIVPQSDHAVLVCSECRDQIMGTKSPNEQHWYCLRESMWSEVPPVQVVAYRMLHRLEGCIWAQDLVDQLYLDEAVLSWAQDSSAQGLDETPNVASPTFDSNGIRLSDGDAVTLIKDLEVKGANFTAKRGTLVKNISLTGDPALIEGKVNGTQIVLKTAFLKKA